MILRRVRVEGFRCFRNPVTLDGLGVGIHIVHAPNETGKSSLVFAVARALFDRYNTGGSEALEMRPWDTELSPRVELELESGSGRFRLRKGFLDGASSVLEEWTGSRFERIAEAGPADERAREFFLGEESRRGLTDLDQWGMARLLWLPQLAGRRGIPGVGASLQARLMDLVGAASLTPAEQGLLDRLGQLHGEYWQPSRGKPKAHSPVTESRAAVEEAQAQVELWRRRCADAAGLDERIGGLQTDLDRLEAVLAEDRRALTQLEHQAEQEAQLERAAQQKRGEAAALQERCKKLQGDVQDLASLRAGLEAHRQALAGVEPGLAVARATLERHRDRLEAAEADLVRARAATEGLERAEEQARQLATLLALRAEQSSLTARLARAQSVETRLAALQQEESAFPSPSDADVRRAGELARKVDQLEAKLEGLGFELVLTPERDLDHVTWDAEGRATGVEATAGKSVVLRGVDHGRLVLPGVAAVELRRSAGDTAKVRTQLEEARGELAHHLGQARVPSIEELKSAQQAGAERSRKLALLQAELGEALGGNHGSLDEARSALRQLEGEVARAAEAVGPSSEAPGDAAPPDVAALTQAVKDARRRLRTLEAERDEAAKAVKTGQTGLEGFVLERTREAQAVATLELQQQMKLEQTGPPEQVQQALSQALSEQALAELAARELASRLPPPGERAAARRTRHQDAIERAGKRERELRDDLARARAELEGAAAAGAYSRLCEAEERLATARARLEREELRSQAVHLLRRLAEARREHLERSVVAPIEAEVSRRLAFIRGGAGGRQSLALTPDLADATLTTQAGTKASVEALSWGTQEQLMLAVRLALGGLLAAKGTEPELVVLDDPLVNTDERRSGRALELIQSAGERLQVLVLTAFPERYRTLTASFHDLQRALQAGE